MNTTAFALFLIIVLGTLVITYFASKKTKNASEFYTAGGGLIVWLSKTVREVQRTI
ncbi:hypothetical protein IIC_01739 [Bacillus cereus VD021]|uniref:Uncharacterized protein n=1 Tax=Bacillus cereus VD021 TaxID=1053224 RepID=R8HTA1_BACCE|nr:hypothetical protein [Bacillus cereus]EOO75996.1 hypothetical protein IIC_01739 [Bacillus cereus VD021]